MRDGSLSFLESGKYTSEVMKMDENNKVILECGRMVEQKDEDEATKCTGRLELTSTELKKLQEEYKDKFPEGL